MTDSKPQIIDLTGDDNWEYIRPETITHFLVNYKKKQMIIKFTKPQGVIWAQTKWIDLYEDAEIFNLPKKSEGPTR